jgi:hypothetical protein
VAVLATFGFVAAGPSAAWAGGTGSAADAARGTDTAGCDVTATFNRKDFTDPTRIDNKWLPLTPGSQFVLEGRANRGGGALPHQVIFTVTGLGKVINGVRSRVIWDQDINEGQLVEAELSFQAQDRVGNVWNMGEYPEEYENGEFTGAPNTWIAGLDRARAGYSMPAKPTVGGPRYLQGSAPEIDFLDCAAAIDKGERVTVPAGCFDHVLVTDEDSPLDPASGHQHKFYAPGVGNVKITAVDDPEGETLVLIRVVHLGRQALNSANKAALALDRHGYEVSPVYRRTPHAQQG